HRQPQGKCAERKQDEQEIAPGKHGADCLPAEKPRQWKHAYETDRCRGKDRHIGAVTHVHAPAGSLARISHTPCRLRCCSRLRPAGYDGPAPGPPKLQRRRVGEADTAADGESVSGYTVEPPDAGDARISGNPKGRLKKTTGCVAALVPRTPSSRNVAA